MIGVIAGITSVGVGLAQIMNSPISNVPPTTRQKVNYIRTDMYNPVHSANVVNSTMGSKRDTFAKPRNLRTFPRFHVAAKTSRLKIDHPLTNSSFYGDKFSELRQLEYRPHPVMDSLIGNKGQPVRRTWRKL